MAEVALVNNGKEIYELLDTAVKIGLGALISGLTTYFITKSNHRHELKKLSSLKETEFDKERFNYKMRMSEKAIEDSREYFSFAKEFNGILFSMSSLKSDYLKNYTKQYTDVAYRIDNNWSNFINFKSKASTTYRILALNELAELLSNYYTILTRMRNKIMTNENKIPEIEEVNEYTNELNKIESKFYSVISDSFLTLR